MYNDEFQPNNPQHSTGIIGQMNGTYYHYMLDFKNENFARQSLKIKQSKPYNTRGPYNCFLNIPDIADFNSQLAPIVDELSNTYLTTFVEEDRGVNKVIRGNHVAAVFSPIRPWPWTRSYTTERLLFDPNLIALIVYNRDAGMIREYCERAYPDLMVDAYAENNNE